MIYENFMQQVLLLNQRNLLKKRNPGYVRFSRAYIGCSLKFMSQNNQNIFFITILRVKICKVTRTLNEYLTKSIYFTKEL